MRHQEKVAKPPQRRRRARSVSAIARNIESGRSHIMFRTQSETWCVSDHPVRDFGTGPFFDVAATPPFQGGEFPPASNSAAVAA
jgi:hypothetical protein